MESVLSVIAYGKRLIKVKIREKGDQYRPIVTIDKMKGERPSVIIVSGERYILDHSNIWKKGRK
jgi:hypothetical protein